MLPTTHRRRLAAVLGAAALATGAAASGGTASAADIDPAAVMSLWSPQKMTTFSYEGYVYTDLGLRIVAGDDPVEIRAHRPTYDDPISATWETTEGPVALPEGGMTSFSGLDEFVTVKITSVKTGKRVDTWKLPACFNGQTTQRVDPEGPARSPYPTSCPWNPYTVGSVMGIERHYATPVTPDYGQEFRLKRGRYDVTATITQQWRDFFGVPAEAASTTTRLVVKRDSCCSGRVPTPRTSGTAVKLQPAGTRAPAKAGAEPPEALRPDLQALPSWNIVLNRKGTQLRFGATVWNAGPSDMVVDGYRSAEDPDHMDAYQFLYDADGNEVYHEAVGQMHWHAANHNHWHFEDFARYRLLTEDLSQAVVSGKQSFCLAPTDATDLTVDGANWKQEIADLGSSCGGYDALSVREALPAGWGDTYFQFRAGQSFDIRKVPDGIYQIAVEANPLGTLLETDTTNNQSLRKIKLFHKGGERRVKVFQVGIVDEFVGGGFFRAPAH